MKDEYKAIIAILVGVAIGAACALLLGCGTQRSPLLKTASRGCKYYLECMYFHQKSEGKSSCNSEWAGVCKGPIAYDFCDGQVKKLAEATRRERELEHKACMAQLK